jgi:ABC-2 type transport system ATP-binding protein
MAIIRVQGVSKEYKVRQQKSGAKGALASFFRPEMKYVQAIKDLSFDIEAGEFVGFIGENGAGKSTMIKMMSGILYPSSGEIQVNEVVPYLKRKENAMQIGVVFGQRSRLVWDLPMADTFALYKEIYRVDKEKYEKNVKLFTDMLEMGDYANTPVRQLSLGQRMRAEIALSMLHEPPILFLDEPTIGLDVVAKKHLRDFFKERNERDGTTIILTSHDMKDLDAISKRIIMITKGEMLFDGTMHALREKYEEESVAEFSFAQPLDEHAAGEFGAVSKDRSKLTIPFYPQKRALPEIIASVSGLGTLNNIEVKSADIEDIVRKIYQ